MVINVNNDSEHALDEIKELIDWNAVPDDPIFRLTFPHRDMLSKEQFERIRELLDSDDKAALDAAVREIQLELNPHPAGQKALNAPKKAELTGVQHKYSETVLFFAAAAQTCHAYCT